MTSVRQHLKATKLETSNHRTATARSRRPNTLQKLAWLAVRHGQLQNVHQLREIFADWNQVETKKSARSVGISASETDHLPQMMIGGVVHKLRICASERPSKPRVLGIGRSCWYSDLTKWILDNWYVEGMVHVMLGHSIDEMSSSMAAMVVSIVNKRRQKASITDPAWPAM